MSEKRVGIALWNGTIAFPPSGWILVGVSLFILARLWGLSSFSLDGDEIFSLRLARQSWASLFDGAIADTVHPPLFYIILKVWISVVGESLGAIRMLSALVSVGSLLVFLTICNYLRLDKGATGLATLLIAANSFLVVHHQWVRMYVFLEFFGICSLAIFLRVLYGSSPLYRAWLALIGVNTALIYIHYYGWFVLGLEGLFVLLARRRVALFVGHGVVLVALFMPWMIAAYGGAVAKGGVPNVSWYPRPSFGHFATYFSELAGRVPIRWGARIGLLLCFFPICLLVIKGLRQRLPVWVSRELVIGLLLISCLPVTIAFVVSQFASQSIWGGRHLISSAMPFLLLVSLSVMAIESVRWRRTGVAVLAGWALVAGFCAITQENRKLAWNRLAREIAESRPNVAVNVYCLENFTYLPLAFYVSEQGHKNLAVEEVATLPSGAGPFWLVVRETGIDEARAVLESPRYNVGTPITIEKQYTKVLAYPVSAEAPGRAQPGHPIRSATAAGFAN